MTTAELNAIVIMANLTAKQQRALSQAPKRDRARLQQTFIQQNAVGRSRPSGGRSAPANRTHGTRVLAQGAGALPSKPFGSGQNAGNGSVKKALTQGLNARLPYHLGLPRPVAGYQVIRTSKLVTMAAQQVILSPLMRRHRSADSNPQWYAACGVYSVDSAQPINAAGNTRMIDMPLATLGAAADLVPAALTVQVMCGNSLQTASGVFTMGRVTQQLNLGGDSRTWNQFKEQFDGYFKPRLLTGGKLALRGVTCNAIPIDMNEYSEFAPRIESPSDAFTWNTEVTPAALTPIVITHSQAGSVADLQLLVTIEWRVRFDPASPAAASHSFHPSTPDSVWGEIMKSASDMGHGVVDIADAIAEAGSAINSM